MESLFPQGKMEGLFKDIPLKLKDFRKYFSKKWDGRGGPTSVKKILM